MDSQIRRRSITLKVDKDGYVTIDEAVRKADEGFNHLMGRKKK